MRKTLAALLAATALAGPAQAADPLKIGTILSTTGPAAFLGEDMKDGMEIAIDEINAAGGIQGRKIEWKFYDAESQTAKALASTRRLLSQDRVDILVGGGNMSGIAQAMVPLAHQSRTPFISTEGAATIASPAQERAWVFKSTVDDSQVFERLADYFKKQGITRIALLHDTSGFGQAAADALRAVAPAHQLQVSYEAFAPSDTDLTSQLTKIRAGDAQAIVCWTVTPAGVIFMRQARQLGLNDRKLIHSYGFVSQRYMELAGADADGVLLVSVKFPVGADLPDSDPLKRKIAELTAKFKARYGRDPNQFVAQTYDAIQLAARALAAGPDKESVRGALESVRGYEGVGGVFNFSAQRHSGLAKEDIVLVTWKDGRFRLADYR
ncbi:ABC transporter substrate-binding protein [Bordetella hinzii]|uniref:ABC transporter substrate-binding protein n=1 Tax=Bordetella hinzii TaxID=103855 RepID=UPI003F1BDADE